MAFAFTDIEGSTVRWDRDHEAMQVAVRRHDELMRAAIAANGGHVFKTIGDAFCAAFHRPEDALGAMLEAQRRLAAVDFSNIDGIRVRAAIHLGSSDERDGDYFGPTLNRVALLLAIGCGAQILCSGAAAEALEDRLPPGTSLRALGEHRLKDLSRPERVYQIVAPDLPADFPQLCSLDARPNNLPAVATTLIGREREVAEIDALLESARLVTVVGAGGVGKTRVTLQVAANRMETVRDGAWLIELAPLARGEYIAATVAQTLRVSLAREGDPIENLAESLRDKQLLLVLDNCEHLIGDVARAVAAILRRCPGIEILASSRQPLAVDGETVYRMPSLGFPTHSVAELKAIEARRFPSVMLFEARARAADPRFSVTDANAAAVADICRRLDGIPLALELAAVRVKLLSPEELRDRLDARFRVLTQGRRDALPRQQTLRALIDWSHDLLDERERTLFRRLGIFANDFGLESVTAIVSDPPLAESDVFDGLASLVDKSLVVAETEGSESRYHLLESTRAYAREKLEAAGERAATAARHLRALRDRFWRASKRLSEAGIREQLDAMLVGELDDIRAALDFALSDGDLYCGGELLAALGSRWTQFGHDLEGQHRLEAFASALNAEDPALVARLWYSFSFLAAMSGRTSSTRAATLRAVALARTAGDAEVLAGALHAHAWNATMTRSVDEAEEALGEAEALPASHGMRLSLLQARATLNTVRGNVDAAVAAYEQLAAAYRALGNVGSERITLLNLAECEQARGRTRRALQLIEELLPDLRAGTDRAILAYALANSAGYALAAGDEERAIAAAREALRLLAPVEPGSVGAIWAIEHLALALGLQGDLVRAARLAAYADEALRALGQERQHTEMATHERLTSLLREGLGDVERERLAAEGATLSAQAAIALALAET